MSRSDKQNMSVPISSVSIKWALALAKLTAMVGGGAALHWRSKVAFSDQLF